MLSLSPSGSYKTGRLNHQHPGIVFGKVPSHGPPLYKIQISYKTCGMSNITVSEVNSAPAWLIAVNLLLGGVLLASVASFDNILSFIILSTQAVHKTVHNLLLCPVMEILSVWANLQTTTNETEANITWVHILD